MEVSNQWNYLKFYNVCNSLEKHFYLEMFELKEEKEFHAYLSQLTSTSLFKCPNCNVKFANKDLLEKHYANHLVNEPFVCPCCYAKSKSNISHIQHLLRHAKRFSCSICNENFQNKKELEDHLKCHSLTEKEALLKEAQTSMTNRFNKLVHKCLLWNFMLRRNIKVIYPELTSIHVLRVHGIGALRPPNSDSSNQRPHFTFENQIFHDLQKIIDICEKKDDKTSHNEADDFLNYFHTPAIQNEAFDEDKSFKMDSKTSEASTNTSFSILQPIHLSGDYEVLTEEKEIRLYLSNRVDGTESPCPRCDLLFTDHFQLEKHYYCHVLKQPFLCPSCFRQLDELDSFLDHLMKHSQKVSLKCFWCGEFCQELSGLEFHLNSFHSTAENESIMKSAAKEVRGHFQKLVHYFLTRNSELIFDMQHGMKSVNDLYPAKNVYVSPYEDL